MVAVLLDCGLLETVEIAQQIAPFDSDTGVPAKNGQFLLEDKGREGAEGVAADGDIGRVSRSVECAEPSWPAGTNPRPGADHGSAASPLAG